MKLWVVCIICAVTVATLNYSYNNFVCLFVLVTYAAAVSLDLFVYVDSCSNFLCDIFSLFV